MPLLTITHPDAAALRGLLALCTQHLPEAGISFWNEPSGELVETVSSPEPPSSPEPSPELREHAARIYAVIRPVPGQHERMKFLKGLYYGSDTIEMNDGALTGDLVSYGARGLSRTLNRHFVDGSVRVDHLYTARKTTFPDGGYRATEYRLTELGKLVIDLFSAEFLRKTPKG